MGRSGSSTRGHLDLPCGGSGRATYNRGTTRGLGPGVRIRLAPAGSPRKPGSILPTGLRTVGAFSVKRALLHENPFSWRAERCAQPQAAALARHAHRRHTAPAANRVLYTTARSGDQSNENRHATRTE